MRDQLEIFLQQIGAFETRHSVRTLGDHLLGTYDLLKANGCDESVCIGGGLHSIYGTNAFHTKIIMAGEDGARNRVAKKFGDYPERLAFLFSILSRPQCLDNDHPRKEFHDLRLIEAANLLEQGGTLNRWPYIKATWEGIHPAQNGPRPTDERGR